MTTNMTRDLATEIGNLFLVTPYGQKPVTADRLFDFDGFHNKVTAPTVARCGMTVHRADSIYGPAGVLDTVWRGIQKAEVVIVDFTGRSPNVAIEFAWAMLLNKRIIVLTQDEDDVPTDVRGLYRYIKYSEHFDDVEHMRDELGRQLEAIREEPAEEKMLSPIFGGTEPATAQVIAVDPEFVTVRTHDGRLGILANTDVDWARIINMTNRFRIGQPVDGAFVTDRKGTRYSMISGQANPWHKLVADYPPGTRLTGDVQSVNPAGAFIHVGHGVNGRVRNSELTAYPGLDRGHRVEVTVTRIDPDRRLIDLRLERVLGEANVVVPSPDLPSVGTGLWAEICAIKPAQPGRSGGYLLLTLPGRQRPAVLPHSAMSNELRRDFDTSDLQISDEIYVEITSTDPVQNRVVLRDVLAPEEQDQTEHAAA